MGSYRAVVAAIEAVSQRRTTAGEQPRSTDWNSVRASHRHSLGNAAAGDELRLRHDLLAETARLASRRSLGPAASAAAESVERRSSNRLVARGRRLGVGASGGCRTKTGPNPTDRAKPGTKHHVVTDGNGIPLATKTTGANAHDVTALIELVDGIPPIAGRRGHPRHRPERVQGDRGYDSDPHRAELRERGIQPELARRHTEHGSGMGKTRWVVERTLSWLHQFRRLRIRFERRADIHEAFLAIGVCLVCWNFI